MAHLEAINGPHSGVQHGLDRVRTRLGRHPNCDVLVDSGGSVSRFHAEITQNDDAYFVQDSNSRNGTFVNGQLISQPERLYDNDRIQICDLVFVYRDDRAKAQRPAADVNQSPITAVMVNDDSDRTHSSIMSRLEVSSSGRHLHVRASADAKLRALMELADNLAKALSVDDVLIPVLESLFKVFLQADQGFIVLQDEEGRWEPRCTRFRRPSNDNVRISRSIVDHVMTSREAVLSADAADDSRFELSESIANLRIRSFICAPLIDTEGHVLGAVQIDAIDSQNRFRDEDLELAVCVASQAGIAIQRARLHDEAIKSRQVEAELDLARQVQLALLPEGRPDLPGYDFYEYYRAANKIGGDYYDYVPLPDGRLAALVADVSGHGIAAAMVMAKLAADVRFCLATIDHPGQVVDRLNHLLCQANAESRFVTMVLMVLNPTAHEVHVVNAGHFSPLLRNHTGEVRSLPREQAGPLMGVIEDAQYEQATFSLAPGDTVTIFTDGVTEAMHPDGGQYGEQRLQQQLAEPGENAESLGRRVIQDVAEFIDGGIQTDDVCLVCVRRLPGS